MAPHWSLSHSGWPARVVQAGKPFDRGRNPGQRLKFDRREPTLIILMGFRQFLHSILILGSLSISAHLFSHESNVERCLRLLNRQAVKIGVDVIFLPLEAA